MSTLTAPHAWQARLLTGDEIDALSKNGLLDALGTRWLMTEQECDYRPPRGPPNGTRGGVGSGGGPLDIAVLMVDNRPPLPYRIEGTPFRSPDAWGSRSAWGPTRHTIRAGWVPPAAGGGGADSAGAEVGPFQMALIINHAFSLLHGMAFYLEDPCPFTTLGVSHAQWHASVPEALRTEKFATFTPSLQKYLGGPARLRRVGIRAGLARR